MARITLILVIVAVLATPCALAQGVKADKKLIPVTPAYKDTFPIPAQAPAPRTADPMAPAAPTPGEQLYVFWLAGKLLSYPIDRAEELFRTAWRQMTPAQAPEARPASAPGDVNPFAAVNTSEIPPAPPVSLRTGVR